MKIGHKNTKNKSTMSKSYSTKGNQGGMGPIRAPQPKKKPGSVWRNMKSFDIFLAEDLLNEEGTAMATAGNTGGMGAIVAPQPSSTPGDVAGSTTGSGDLPAKMGTSFKNFPYEKKKKKKKKSKKSKSKKEKYESNDFATMYITKYTEWDYPKESKINEDINWISKKIKNYLKDLDQGMYITVKELVDEISSVYGKSTEKVTASEIQDLIYELGSDVNVVGKEHLQKLINKDIEHNEIKKFENYFSKPTHTHNFKKNIFDELKIELEKDDNIQNVNINTKLKQIKLSLNNNIIVICLDYNKIYDELYVDFFVNWSSDSTKDNQVIDNLFIENYKTDNKINELISKINSFK